MNRTGLPNQTRRACLGAAAFGLACHPAALVAQEPAAGRVALVVGNAAYRDAALPNAGKDAAAMAQALRSLGFAVIEVQDGTRDRMLGGLEEARRRLSGGKGVGLFYYAGHGIQLAWSNFIVPVDAELAAAADVPLRCLPAQAVVDAFRGAATRVNILILDACRNNPFAGFSTERGLAPMDAPVGTYVAYATAPGHVAEDGSTQDGNGLYTRFLLAEMRRPEASIEEVFKRVRAQVRQASRGRQVPWDSSSLEDDFVFASGRRVEAADRRAGERLLEAERADWERVRAGRPDDAEAIYAFLLRHPNGYLAELAQFRLDQLQRPVLLPQPGRDGLVHLPSGQPRWTLGDVATYDLFDNVRQVQRRFVQRVTKIEGDRVELNGGFTVLDQMGGTLKNQFGSYEPAILIAPADIALGKRWRVAYEQRYNDGGRASVTQELRVVGIEPVEALGRTLLSYRVERSGEARDARGLTFRGGTSWIDPRTMLVVRSTIVNRVGERVTEDSGYTMLKLERRGA